MGLLIPQKKNKLQRVIPLSKTLVSKQTEIRDTDEPWRILTPTLMDSVAMLTGDTLAFMMDMVENKPLNLCETTFILYSRRNLRRLKMWNKHSQKHLWSAIKKLQRLKLNFLELPLFLH